MAWFQFQAQDIASRSENQQSPTSDMACFKTLSLSGGCALETCETKDVHIFGADEGLYQQDRCIAYSPDHCYCLMTYYNVAGTTTYIGKYDLATNTLIQKVDLGAFYDAQPVYDATAQKFVLNAGLGVMTYDPITETTETFNPGITGGIGALLYIPQKGKVYGTMGVNGSNERFVGYIDLELQTIVQLGILPGIGLGRPSPTNWGYSTVSDSMYGNWASGADQRMVKFDLSTNTASYIVIGLNAAPVWWDGDRNLMVMAFGQYTEFNTATDTADFAVGQGPDFSLRFISFKDPSTNIIWGRARDSVTSLGCFGGINLNDFSWVMGLNDYIYGKPIQFDGGSCIVPVTNLAETQSGIRKVCVT